ncbi:ABC transporter ATP-binding protein [Cupriavidus oxalaticus]|uniref:ABC transporter ATP-binding protein n=1 Tax=Cupriavidus oxalaticus TaxID=96344 RepID=A0A4P7LEF0_9BURK|nr:ABC transporter ATP-binding protein [Cupriavidus oxalaticus]QBY54025.1 ABC transporter ATP-binding protein [Cupriavidus oxalaticus]
MGKIQVTGVGKAYRQYSSRWSRLLEWIIPGNGVRHHLKWVLRDISFEVKAGEAVGIVGINGAGKSTLLKMITGTSQPTAGAITVSGRVAAMLELGMGFHPDFTGRQNVYMAGQLLGLSVPEIDALIPEIQEFAEIGDYFDEPVRTYSSGMQMRVAFSVATAKRPDILIVDEALSVGDTYFQHKSFERIRKFRAEGTTLLIVSHDKMAIQSICDRAILLNAGRLEREGSPEEIMDFYNAMLAERESDLVRTRKLEDGRTEVSSGTGEATVVDIGLYNHRDERVEVIDVGTEVTLRIKVAAQAHIPRLVCGYMIKDRVGQPVFGTNSDIKRFPLSDVVAGEAITFEYRFPLNLGAGSYSIATALTSTDTHMVNNYEWRDLALVFTVANLSREHFIGSAWLDSRLEIIRT